VVLTDTTEQLRMVALDAVDASGYFPAMYARVTKAVDDTIAGNGFADGSGMATFARTFAGRYLTPRSGRQPIPGCWEAAWDVSGDRGLLIVQHLLLGMNAHVNHDLPLVVVDLAHERGGLDAMRSDFDAINRILAATQPQVMHDLESSSRWVNLASGLGGGRMFDFSLVVARRQAWRSAVRLHGMDPADRPADVAELDELVRVLAYMIAHPGAPTCWMTPLLRRLEDNDPDRVTRKLLGPLA
jgi:hypothetical protein